VRRLARYTFNALTVLSLLLCVGTVVMWVRSYRVVQWGVWAPAVTSNKGYGFESRLGEITLKLMVSSDPLDAYESECQSVPVSARMREGQRLWLEHESWHGFSLTTDDFANLRRQYGTWHRASAPYWFAVLCLGFLPLARLFHRHRLRKVPVGHCPTCGYDLRATPDRCPECGEFPPTAILARRHSGRAMLDP
jgi:hypothetical protein